MTTLLALAIVAAFLATAYLGALIRWRRDRALWQATADTFAEVDRRLVKLAERLERSGR